MALSDEQNAMLRLLAQGEQGYADIAALMGLSEAEVRAKVVGALAQLQAEGRPVPDVPPPVPGGAKPAAEVAPPEPEPVERVESPTDASAEPAEPVIADSVAPRAAPAVTPPASPPPPERPRAGGRTVTLPSGRNAWLLGGGIAAVIIAIVVVIVLASGGGGGDNGGASTAGTEGKTETAAASQERTEAKLKAVDGSEASGLAAFGRVKDKLALQVEATGLEPTTAGTDSYTVWLAQSPQKMLPLAFPVEVKASGKGARGIAAQFEVPVEILAYLANGTFDQIAITRTDNKRMEASLKTAREKKTSPAYTGEAVLRGTITGRIVGLAVREEEAKKKKESGE